MRVLFLDQSDQSDILFWSVVVVYTRQGW